MAKTSVPKGIKYAVLNRDEYKCQIQLDGCSGHGTGCDHRAGRGSGGSKVLNGMSNLIAACWNCNWGKETLHGEARAELVRRGVIIAMAGTNEKTALKVLQTPFIAPDGTVYMLTDDGGKEAVF